MEMYGSAVKTSLDRLQQPRLPPCTSQLSRVWEVPGCAKPSPDRTEAVPRRIAHYEILHKLGEGAMGVVYKAADLSRQETVALKLLLPSSVASERDKAGFQREAQAAAAVDHPNVCRVFEIEEANGQPFIAMAYLEGEDLAARMTQGPCALQASLQICVQVARGLSAIHEAGVIHCDIKPANILLTTDGRAVIIDFGLAQLPGLPNADREMAGTLAYMSPEQALAAPLDRRTDIWSTGVLLYELLTGDLPFRGKCQEIFYSLVNEQPEPLPALDSRPEISRLLQKIVETSLAKRMCDRYGSAGDLGADLESALATTCLGLDSRGASFRCGMSMRRGGSKTSIHNHSENGFPMS